MFPRKKMAAAEFWQSIVNALSVGSVYILVASGLALVFSIMRIFNFAHGEFYMLGAYGVFFLFSQLGLNYPSALAISMLATAALGILVERFMYRPYSAPEHHLGMVISISLILIIEGLAFLAFKPVERFVGTPIPGQVMTAWGTIVPWQRIMVIAAGGVVILALFAFVKWSRWGQAMRAIADDEVASALQGIESGKIRSMAFGLGCALAGLAGGLVATGIPITPAMGGTVIFKVFIIIVIGGFGSIAGAAVGGLFLALIESFGTFFLGFWVDALMFGILILVLLVRPTGFMGRE